MKPSFPRQTVSGAPPESPCRLVRDPGDPCPHLLAGVVNVIGDKWSMLIVGTLGNFKTLRFNELREKLEAISPKTLAEKLRRLSAAGLVFRRSFDEMPPRTEYSLTNEGETMRSALMPLLQWAEERDHRRRA